MIFYKLEAERNTLDKVLYPRRGSRLQLSGKRNHIGEIFTVPRKCFVGFFILEA